MIKYILNLFGITRAKDRDMLEAENYLLKAGMTTLQDALSELKNENDLLRRELTRIHQEERLIKEQLLQEFDLLLLQQSDTIGEA